MTKILLFLSIIFISLNLFLSAPSCEEGKKFCSSCNVITNICKKCQFEEILTPDENGGCKGLKKCEAGINYCEECDEDKALCKECNPGYFPDENGACALSQNCQISRLGLCLLCDENFIVIRNGNNLCKSLGSDDFKNCKEIDESTGFCKECEEGFFLDEEDKKCSDSESCLNSVYSQCIECIRGYYLDHHDKKKCKWQYNKEITKKNITFAHCKETEDGENCSKCDKNFFFDSEGKCCSTHFCVRSENFECQECQEGYIMAKYGGGCVKTEHCLWGGLEEGLCISCEEKFYLDENDGQCKNNQEDDDLKFCRYFTDKCVECDMNYKLGTDFKCSNTDNCAESEFGICKKCQENFHLDKNNKCTSIEHCIVANNYNSCEECEDGFYFNKKKEICSDEEEKLKNCKITNADIEEDNICLECKENFYLLVPENKCLSNNNKENDDKEPNLFYKCAISSDDGSKCFICENNYYLDKIDKRCSKIANCGISENENKCKQCADYFCLNLKTGTCESNFYVEKEEGKMLYKCEVTNEEGTACDKCVEGFKVGKNGFCQDQNNCLEEKDGVCIKCKNDENNYYCPNKDFNCVESYWAGNCTRCDNVTNFDTCTECEDGYQLENSGFTDDEYICVEK